MKYSWTMYGFCQTVLKHKKIVLTLCYFCDHHVVMVQHQETAKSGKTSARIKQVLSQRKQVKTGSGLDKTTDVFSDL